MVYQEWKAVDDSYCPLPPYTGLEGEKINVYTVISSQLTLHCKYMYTRIISHPSCLGDTYMYVLERSNVHVHA